MLWLSGTKQFWRHGNRTPGNPFGLLWTHRCPRTRASNQLVEGMAGTRSPDDLNGPMARDKNRISPRHEPADRPVVVGVDVLFRPIHPLTEFDRLMHCSIRTLDCLTYSIEIIDDVLDRARVKHKELGAAGHALDGRLEHRNIDRFWADQNQIRFEIANCLDINALRTLTRQARMLASLLSIWRSDHRELLDRAWKITMKRSADEHRFSAQKCNDFGSRRDQTHDAHRHTPK